MQSSSSLFRKFASDNVGNGFRRPKPKDNDANRANEIFDKYSRTSVTESPSSQEGKVINTSFLVIDLTKNTLQIMKLPLQRKAAFPTCTERNTARGEQHHQKILQWKK